MTDGAAELAQARTEPTLQLKLYSHATLESRDLEHTRRFFNEFLGFETVLMSRASFWARLGGETVIVVVQGGKSKSDMPFLNHNGLDVATDAEVDAAHAVVRRDAELWGLRKITSPKVVHGTYCFYFWDRDDNAWEMLSNPQGGYNWGFERGDQEGSGHMGRDFVRPGSTARPVPPTPIND